uniref:CDP-diacylglycerol--inositol 3-phosphatidyltransferase n=1 Tax=Chaetoceros debilis TaxID=122233 RepID=A0A7S3V4V0_9STRA
MRKIPSKSKIENYGRGTSGRNIRYSSPLSTSRLIVEGLPINPIRAGSIDQRKLPIPLYLPNIICYSRVILSLISLITSWLTVVRGDNFVFYFQLTACLWILASFLDNIDGKIAKKLGQCSELGVLLDIIADNILRSCSWVACIMMGNQSNHKNMWLPVLAVLSISIEWMTMLSTQLLAIYQEKEHWKDVNTTNSNASEMPWLVNAILRNNFRSIWGGTTMYGSMGCAMVHFGHMNRDLLPKFILIPYDLARYVAYFGRVMAFFVETWFCLEFLRLVVKLESSESVVNTD